MQPLLSLTHLSKTFGGNNPAPAVQDVTFHVNAGEVVGFMGPNGAGKSTTMRMIAGFLSPTGGDAAIAGHSITQARQAALQNLGYLAEQPALYEDLTPREYLNFLAEAHGLPRARRKEQIDIVSRLTRCHAYLHRPMGDLSKGMRQRLGFAQALLGKPEVLFLDEPTNGLDPQAIRDFYFTLRELQQTGVTIVITSHILSELQERVDSLAILAAGKLQAQGSVQQLREDTGLPLVVEVDVAAERQSQVVEAVRTLVQAEPVMLPRGVR